MRRRALKLSTALAISVGCGHTPADPAESALPKQADPAAKASATPPDAPPSGAETEPVVLITDRETLARLEPVLGLSKIVSSAEAWTSIVSVIEAHLAKIRYRDRLSGVGMRHAHRLFDARWLRSPRARFALVGITNRLDRAPFQGNACGETRLIYRLEYRTRVSGTEVASRLPLTVALELRASDRRSGSCADAARRWHAPRGAAGEALARWVISPEGPIGPIGVSLERLSQLAVNLQTVRWPATVRPDMGGHAEYALLAFAYNGRTFSPKRLENTPDVAAIQQSAAKQKRLLAWIESSLSAIDAGTAVLPEELLATQAVSVTPRGFGRRANRPYRSLLEPRALDALALDKTQRIRSPEALIRRLDELSCNGCHQARSVAGFHLLGQDPLDTDPGNGLAIRHSPHLQGELERRREVTVALAAGKEPSFARPFAERGPERGVWGARCGLGDPGFADWTCEPGLSCRPYDVAADEPRGVGVCLPSELGQVGDPCQIGQVSVRSDAHRDHMLSVQKSSCSGAMYCEPTKIGFPGGTCTGTCKLLGEHGECGAIARLDAFNACIAHGRTPFAECIAKNSFRAALRACSDDRPCRDDYVCAATAEGGAACIPPYFLFQLRVDGHPAP